MVRRWDGSAIRRSMERAEGAEMVAHSVKVPRLRGFTWQSGNRKANGETLGYKCWRGLEQNERGKAQGEGHAKAGTPGPRQRGARRRQLTDYRAEGAGGSGQSRGPAGTALPTGGRARTTTAAGGRAAIGARMRAPIAIQRAYL